MKSTDCLVLLLVTAACASRSLETGPSLGAPPTVQVWMIELDDLSNSSVLQARNDGTSPVAITELRLSNCSNLRQECGTHTLDVRIEPGQTVRIARLDPSNHAQRPRFAWEYRWRGLAGTVTTPPLRLNESFREVSVEELVPIVDADERNPRCSNPPTVEGSDQRFVGMRFGPRQGGLPTRNVTVRVDAQGRVTHYSESRGDLRVTPPGVTTLAAVDDPRDRSSFSIDMAAGAVLLTNQRPGATPERLVARGSSSLLDAASLGVPRNTILRILSECAP